MSYPWSAGEILTATELNEAFSDNGLEQFCIATASAMTIPTGVGSFTEVLFGTDVYDVLGWHSTASLQNRFIPGVTGNSYYQVNAGVLFANNLAAADRVAVAILVNGSGTTGLRQDIAAASANILVPTVQVSGVATLTSNTDYISIGVLHSNASGRNVDARVSIKRIG
jgi:hypothetical protein